METVPLANLIQALPLVLDASSGEDIPITGIALDSREVQPGQLFVALAGGNVDGHTYISEALKRGAAAVIGTQDIRGLPIPYIRVPESREALAYLSAAFFGYPARSLTVIGVTGTDGKTTTTNLIYQILKTAGVRAGMISTVNAVIGSEILDTGFHVTTPEAPEVQSYLRQMVDAGLTHIVLETTSHGLAQHRVTACDYDLGVVTNITHEHLDYHGSFEAYREAKARLFTGLAATPEKKHGNPRVAVLNLDDSSYEYLSSVTSVTQVSYGLGQQAQVRGMEIETTPQGLRFLVEHQGTRWPVSTELLGDYNVSNCLAAFAATVVGMGISPEDAVRGIAALQGIPGRMELVDLGQEFISIVDFAHTPAALQRALQAARQMVPGRLISVFGSAGLRDREKRRMMAEVSVKYADLTILTAEDPRTESLEGILDEMAQGANSQGGVEGKTYWRIPDRGEAIRYGVQMAHKGDVLIVCGKGHEQSMCFGTTEYPWDDRQAMKAALAERLNRQGPSIPYLPTQNFPEEN